MPSNILQLNCNDINALLFHKDMGTYKSEVGNKACPKGCIVESWIQNECLTFCSRYLSMTETKFNRIDHNDA